MSGLSSLYNEPPPSLDCELFALLILKEGFKLLFLILVLDEDFDTAPVVAVVAERLSVELFERDDSFKFELEFILECNVFVEF
jgi:hypothetical protein